jgi:hypothetical protein
MVQDTQINLTAFQIFILTDLTVEEMRRQREGTVLGTPLSDLGYTAKYRYATNINELTMQKTVNTSGWLFIICNSIIQIALYKMSYHVAVHNQEGAFVIQPLCLGYHSLQVVVSVQMSPLFVLILVTCSSAV